MNDFGIYIHWPFCKSKCPYCDFNSHVRASVDDAAWANAYAREISYYAGLTGRRKVGSVFFGGGTPSLMSPQTVVAVVAAVRAHFELADDAEITLEANPTSVEADKLKAFREAGINRVSLGVQALDDKALQFLGRQHSAAEAMKAVGMAAEIFPRYSFDLIYARPQQTILAWKDELAQALSYGPSHLSLYQLTIEEGTAFHTLHQRGELVVPNQDEAADLYELTQEIMGQAGMPAYEVSNHAAEKEQSRHNLVYWRYGDYVGVGPGAHGRLTLGAEKVGTRAHRAPEIWMQRTQEFGHGAHPFEPISSRQRGEEMLMMGLRLKQGVALKRFQEESGQALSDFVNTKALQQMIDAGFLQQDENNLRPTPAGLQRLSSILKFILDEECL